MVKHMCDYVWAWGGGGKPGCLRGGLVEENAIIQSLSIFQKERRPRWKSGCLSSHPPSAVTDQQAASASPGSLLEMLSLRPRPRPTDCALTFETCRCAIHLFCLSRYWLTTLIAPF